jgi:hypothetical protein
LALKCHTSRTAETVKNQDAKTKNQKVRETINETKEERTGNGTVQMIYNELELCYYGIALGIKTSCCSFVIP